jgi:hypothetical protein
MANSVCAGCGKALPSRSGRGRPATYHGPACRQRARRARLATDPGRAELLSLLDQAGQAIATARRAVISGDNPHAALAELAATVESANASEAPDVTSALLAVAKRPPMPVAEPPTVTEFVTEAAASKVRLVTHRDVIDVDTVRVERGEDFEISGTYRVLAGDSILLGYLARDRRRRWEARTATTALTVPGGPWHTRQDALVGLLLNSGIRTTGT